MNSGAEWFGRLNLFIWMLQRIAHQSKNAIISGGFTRILGDAESKRGLQNYRYGSYTKNTLQTPKKHSSVQADQSLNLML